MNWLLAALVFFMPSLSSMQIVMGAAPAGAPSITLVQSNSVTTGSATSLGCTLSGSVASGDLVIVQGGMYGTGATVTAVDSASNSLAHVTASPMTYGPGEWTGIQMFEINPSTQSGGTTITVSQAGGAGANVMFEGCAEYHSSTGWKTSPLDGSMSAFGTSTATSVATSITTSGANALLISTVSWETAGSTSAQSVASPFTKQTYGGTGTYKGTSPPTGGNLGVAADDQAGVGAGTYTATFSWTGADNQPGVLLSGFDTN